VRWCGQGVSAGGTESGGWLGDMDCWNVDWKLHVIRSSGLLEPVWLMLLDTRDGCGQAEQAEVIDAQSKSTAILGKANSTASCKTA
jgi:hypothetical protein